MNPGVSKSPQHEKKFIFKKQSKPKRPNSAKQGDKTAWAVRTIQKAIRKHLNKDSKINFPALDELEE